MTKGLNVKRTAALVLVILVLASALTVACFLMLQSPSADKNPRTNPIATLNPPFSINPDSVGICVHTLTQSDAQLINASGARWIRIDCNNTDSQFGNYLQNAKTYNLSVLAILDSWLFNGNCDFTLDEWNSSVTHYVTQYADYVDAWEIWNEPASPTYPLLNLNLTNQNSQQNMATIVDFYYSMAQTAYPIIRHYDPNATILLFGGLNLYSAGDPNLMLDQEFATKLAAKGVQQYGDVIAVHAYPWANEAGDPVWNSYNDSLLCHGELFPHKELWVTETGQKIQEGCTEQMQADYLTQELQFFDGKVDRVFWYALYDDASGNFGLIANGVPRSAYNVMNNTLNP